MDLDILKKKKVVLKNYLEIESLLNNFFAKVNYCVPHCIDNDRSKLKGHLLGVAGCCDKDYFSHDNKFKLNKLLSRKRIRLFGKPKSNNFCGYHTRFGCVLESHKNPLCLLMICDPFQNYLIKEYNINFNDTIKPPVFKLVNCNSTQYEVDNLKGVLKSYIYNVSSSKVTQ